MKSILLFSLVIYSCNSMQGEKTSSEYNQSDTVTSISSVNGMTKEEFIANYKDSVMKKINRQVALDTAGLSSAPVKVLRAVMVKEEYSNYKSISLTFKNISDKQVDAIKFSWYGENAFGEPADMGNSFLEGSGGGFTESKLSPGKSRTSEWSILSRDGKKVILAWPYEVVFSDGAKWKLKN